MIARILRTLGLRDDTVTRRRSSTKLSPNYSARRARELHDARMLWIEANKS